MNVRHGRGAFTDGAADALHRTGAHVADGKHAGDARFEGGGHIRGRVALGGQTCQEETVRIEPDAAAFQPLRLGIRSDKQEHMPNGSLLLDPVASVAPRHGGKAAPGRRAIASTRCWDAFRCSTWH